MVDGITRLAVEGFKSISQKQSIDIAPLTILAGANSSGKSSIIQPLLMLKQTLDAVHDPGPLLISGGNVKFTSSDQFLSKTNAPVRRLLVEIATQGFEFHVTFSKASRTSPEILDEELILAGRRQRLTPNMPSHTIRETIGKAYAMGDGPDLAYSVVPNRFFLDVKTQSGPNFRFMERIEPFIKSVIHVPGLRKNPSRTYPAAAVGPEFPATFEYYVASLIDHWQTTHDDRARALDHDLRHIGLSRNIRAARLSEVEIDLQVGRTIDSGPNDTVSIADVGFGVSQTLPALVALRAADQGQLVYIEEPEIHLHPRAQVKLADIFAAAAERGVRVIAETHSSLLLRALQTAIANGKLAPNLVRFHWFTRDAEGVTHISSATPDENGAFGDWPEDFGDVALQSEQDYLDAVENKIAR